MEFNNQSKIECNQQNVEDFNCQNNLINKKEEENVNIDEMKYLNQIKEIMENGVLKSDRTGTGVIPLLTTKRVFWKGIVEELLWFIRGETNSKTLSDRGVKIWDANGSRQFLDSIGHFERPEGDLGPIYGFQWRHFGAEYRGMNENYKNEGIDQLSQVIKQVKEEPDSRRIIMCSWNVKGFFPCHLLCQFYVNNGELSCQLYQRSGDMGLGVPFNIASYSLLTHMIAHVTGLKAGEFIHTLGDAHIYSTHIEALKTQLQRKPRPFPKIRFELPEGKEILNIEDFTPESIIIEEYNPYGPLKMQMAL
uniref:Thymidylate synthase n=1 Tax=Meloidogyne hapla TaxID=6305 RepID=A0A1I8C2M7_MELHA